MYVLCSPAKRRHSSSVSTRVCAGILANHCTIRAERPEAAHIGMFCASASHRADVIVIMFAAPERHAPFRQEIIHEFRGRALQAAHPAASLK
jgi:hypothetical protein